MPSPVGHALGALAVGWMMAGPAPRGARLAQGLWIGALGVAADLDLLIGRHSMETHSVGAAVIAGAIAAACRLPLASTRTRTFLTATLAWLTHPLLDALGADTSVPLGVMLFWPVSTDHVLIARVFDGISRQWWREDFVRHNLLAALREVMRIGPFTLVAWIVARRAARSRSARE